MNFFEVNLDKEREANIKRLEEVSRMAPGTRIFIRRDHASEALPPYHKLTQLDIDRAVWSLGILRRQ